MSQMIESLIPRARAHSIDSMFEKFRSLRSRLASSRDARPPTTNGVESVAQQAAVLNVASYSLVLMDSDGQVVWTREWDAGGVFQFGPRQHLHVFCGFTNHSADEAEISEYEIELMGEDGLIIERFNTSFGDAVIVPPGESRQFPAEWHM